LNFFSMLNLYSSDTPARLWKEIRRAEMLSGANQAIFARKRFALRSAIAT